MKLQLRFLALSALCMLLSGSIVYGGVQKNGAHSGNPFVQKNARHVSLTTSQSAAFQSSIATLTAAIAQAKSSNRLPQYSMRAHQSAALQHLEQINGGPVDVQWNADGTRPIFIKGSRLSVPSSSAVDRSSLAMEFLKQNASLFAVADPSSEFAKLSETTVNLGMTHVRYQQVYQGVEIWGSDLYVHLNAGGIVESFNGRYASTPAGLESVAAKITEDDAERTAIQRFSRTPSSVFKQQNILVDDFGTAHLCWRIDLRGNLIEYKSYFVDVVTGRVVKEYNNVMNDGPASGSALDLRGDSRTLNLYQIGASYIMINTSKAMYDGAHSTFPDNGKGVIYTFDAKHTDSSLFYITSSNVNTWTIPQTVSAAANGALVYDYYKTIHNRNAIDGNGSTMNLAVNFKTGYNNAFWNGQFMIFGNGDGTVFTDLAGGLDVTGHEMTHGVVEHTANLVYENQSGALNESFADVFGTLVEFWARGANGNWTLGEDVTTPAVAGDCLRSMQDPGGSNVAPQGGGPQPATMAQYQNLPNSPDGDNGGVHTNSGIPNHAFYLFATSSGVTKEQAGQVYYRALSQYLTRNAQFIDCRLAVIKSAEDLYGGPNNAVALAAAAAFDAVGITGSTGSTPPPAQNPVSGKSYLAVIEASSSKLYRSDADGQNITLLSGIALYSRPTITDDGAYIFYVDQSTNLHIVNSDGTNDRALSTTGGYNNVSVSPDGHYLAVTSTGDEAAIYFIDLQIDSPALRIPLYTPTYSQGATAGNIRYPDRIDWTSDSRIVMYDAFNIAVKSNGDTIGYWDINLLRPSDTAIARLLPPQPEGISMGDPVFASNTDNILAFDYVDQYDSVKVYAVNLDKGDIGLVTNNIFSLGNPTFSSDDKKIFYHYIDNTGAYVAVVDLASDGITGAGNDAVLLNGAFMPVQFSIGKRATSVERHNGTLPEGYALEQNFPNPFNPSTEIGFEIPSSGLVSLRVYDVIGREMTTLVNEMKNAGRYRVRWNAQGVPSGVYFYTLQSGSFSQTRKLVLMK